MSTAFATTRTLRLRPNPRRSLTFLANTSMRNLHTHRQTASKVVHVSLSETKTVTPFLPT